MFSPSVSQAPSASVRSSRRRQRPLSNEGSIVQPKAKRQRSTLSEQTFIPPDGTLEMEETSKSQKIATIAPKREVSKELPGPRREIAVRGKKPKSGDRGNKGDGSVILTTNDTYTVSKLPALPDRLRTDVTVRQHGGIYSDTGYALSLTHSHAIVWPYAVNIQSPESFIFALPYPSKHVSDPLPIGSLVSASASSTEPGLVVVIPTTGKVAYWESIASAATLDLIRQQRNGVETSIQGMHSGETVIDVLNAESAGFVLAFSTGRLAYMSVRDGQGRPAISVQFLRGGNGPSNGGIFGSIRNALGSHALRGDIAAIRAERPGKIGERNIVVATAKGKIQSWNIHRGGHNTLLAEADARETIVLAIKDTQPALRDLLMETFEIVDFTYAPKTLAISRLDEEAEDGVHLLVLVSLTDRHASRYSLVEVVVKRDEFGVRSIRPINSYETPISRNATSKPRLYLPNPAHVAYIVFDKAVVVLSMAKQPESPDTQLRIESHLSPQAFEDVVDFRGDMNVEIVGSGMEEPQGPSHGIEDSKSRRYKAKHPAAILLVRGGGVVRVAATNTDKLISSDAQQVTAKSKLEQAVFFGTLEKNPLSFAVRPELQFTPEEVGAAALELSSEISKSQTPYIPTTLASIEMHLKKRSTALQHLAEHIQTIGVSLDRATRWRLLCDAEKIEAATSIWKSYDKNLKTRPEGQKRGLFTDLVEFIHEDYKSNPVSEAGELDRVRHWFINDVWNLEIAVPWAYQALKHSYQDGRNDHNSLFQTINEADDVFIGALETAFKFREANLSLYGLAADQLEYGVLKANYEDLPEFWTSTFFIVANIDKEANIGIALMKEYWKDPAKVQTAKIDIELLKKLRLDIPKIVDLSVRSSTERIRWIAAQNSPDLQLQATEIQNSQPAQQDEHITNLAEFDLGDEAIAIAEKHRIFPTLATVIMMEVNTCAGSMQRNGIDDEEFDYFSNRAGLLEEHIRRYFDNFGESWATAFYEYDIEAGAMANLLECFQEQRPYLTKFLRSKPEYAKLAWIHEVGREENFDQAAQMLLDLGLKREQDLWSKKIELSMGKLARMAGRKYSQANGILIPDGGQIELIATDEQLGLIKIQDRIYDHVFPSIRDALDEKAEIQLAIEAHGNKGLKKQRRFLAFLEESLGHLVKHESMDSLTLIDLLTLMDGGVMSEEVSQEDADFRGDQFYLALQASRYGDLHKDEQKRTQRLIWRRCLLRDDWAVVNNTELKDDHAVNEQLRTTTLYWTFRACLKNRIFDKDSPIKPMSPSDVLGTYTDELQERFRGLDASLMEGILKDMQTEDHALKPFVEKCRLENWYQSALDLAKVDFAEEVDAETDDGGNMREVAQTLEDIEAQINERLRGEAEKALRITKHTIKENGVSLDRFRSSTRHLA